MNGRSYMASPFRALGELIGISTRSEVPAPSTEPGVASSGLYVGPPSRAVPSVTLDRALTLPSVFRAFGLLSAVVCQLELEVYRGDSVMPTPSLIRQPDEGRTLSSFLRRTVTALAATGNAYWVLQCDAAGKVIALDDLDPLGVRVEYRTNGKFYVSGEKPYPARDIKHLKLMEVPGHDEGVGPIQACRASLQSALDLRNFGDTWIDTAGVPTGVLSTTMQLEPGQREAMQNAWHESLENRKTAVLSNGLKYEPILISPADAQFLESQQYSVIEVARMFGIPAPLLLAGVDGNSLTYTNMETVDRQFISYTVMPYLKEIEDALSSVLPRGQNAKFLLGGLLRPDGKARADIHSIYIENGVMSPSEVRTDLGLHGPAPIAPSPSDRSVEAPTTTAEEDQE